MKLKTKIFGLFWFVSVFRTYIETSKISGSETTETNVLFRGIVPKLVSVPVSVV